MHVTPFAPVNHLGGRIASPTREVPPLTEVPPPRPSEPQFDRVRRASPSKVKQRAIWAGAVAWVLLAIAVGIYSPGNRFQRAYHKLQLGMKRSDTDAVLGKPPDYECRLGRYQICYYRRQLYYGVYPEAPDRNDLPPGDVIHSASELPYVYAAAQLAFDAEGQLVAFTQNGETTEIETTRGTVPGDRFGLLDDTYFP